VSALSRFGLSLAVSGSVLWGAADGAYAQERVRSGFWMEAAKGTGTVRNTCAAGCEGVTVAYGPTYHFRAGGSVGSRVLVGVELFSHRAPKLVLAPGVSAVDAHSGSLTPVVLWYVGESGFYLKGGAGLNQGTYTVRPPTGDPITTERLGTGLTFGVGLDLGLGDRFALTANFDSFVNAVGDVSVDGTLVDDIIATVYEVGIGIVLR
jgi:hypothetical protein